ncbi:MAG: hypothetical protein K6E14_12185, partial [Paludibacteraceae bacterium]|nr:hypothetical protein [Paludibacteraceae bacterium]
LHKQCGLKKICIFGFLEEAWERLASPKPPLKEKKVLTSCQKMGSTIYEDAKMSRIFVKVCCVYCQNTSVSEK